MAQLNSRKEEIMVRLSGLFRRPSSLPCCPMRKPLLWRPRLEVLEARVLLDNGSVTFRAGNFTPGSFAGVGFQENAVANFDGYVNGVPDNNPGDFKATISWGDGTQSVGDVAPNAGRAQNGTFLVKGSHIYAQPSTGYPIVVYLTAPGGSSASGQTASAPVDPMPSAIPGIPPPAVTPLIAPTNVGVTLRAGNFTPGSFAGVGFQENAVANFDGYVNGVADNQVGDFHAFVNWGDSNQWFQADVAPNTGNTQNGTFLVKGSHIYAQPSTAYPIVVYINGPDGTSISAQTANAPVDRNPNPTATTTQLRVNPNPAIVGQQVALQATVTDGNGAPPDGETVTFMDGYTTLGTAALAGGVATFIRPFDNPGVHPLSASYGGDGNLAGSQSPVQALLVNAAGVHQPSPIVVGADAGGGPEVKVYDPTTAALKLDFFAYDPNFHGGVRVAVGDINGDGVPDIITGPGPGGGPEIKVFDGQTGHVLRDFFAFSPNFTGGVYVAAGDVNGDGLAEIIVGADAGGGPQVTVFSGKDGSVLRSFFPYDPNFHGGVRVAAGDVNGDGQADIITGAGPGGGPQVTVLSGADGSVLQSFFAYDPNFAGGVYVAAGDVNGDGHADVIVGAGAGGGPQVRVFSGANHSVLQSFFAFDPRFAGGVRVGFVSDASGDGRGDLITGPGPGGGPQVTVFNGNDLSVLDSFFGFDPHFAGGVYVGGA
jgi:hypothetical protein